VPGWLIEYFLADHRVPPKALGQVSSIVLACVPP